MPVPESFKSLSCNDFERIGHGHARGHDLPQLYEKLHVHPRTEKAELFSFAFLVDEQLA